MEGCNPKNMGQIFDRLHTFLLVSKVLNFMIK